jgi:hypothetical protein
MTTTQKYVRLKDYDSFIIFPQIIEHSTFAHLSPISAGFCFVNNDEVRCYGKSISLGIGSNKEDSKLATRQIFGLEAMLMLVESEQIIKDHKQ